MVRIAKQDTYAMEDVGQGVEVRRKIVAGAIVPDNYTLEDGETEEMEHASNAPRPSRVVTALVEEPEEPEEPEAEPEPAPTRHTRKAK